MKNVAVFFDELGEMEYPFNKTEYWRSYQELNFEIIKAGGTFYITRGLESYMGEGKFSNSWIFHNGGLKEMGFVKVDVIFDKGSFIKPANDPIPVLNNSAITEVCRDKLQTFQLFGRYSPQTYLVLSRVELLEKVQQIHSQYKVIKPRDGGEGKGVIIATSQEILGAEISFPCLLQEFLDTSGGVPDLCDSTHDLRVAFINDNIVLSFIRTPPANSLLANVAQGGSLKVINKDSLPQEAIQLAHKVDDKMRRFGDRVYSVDMALSNSGWKIIELNSSLGLQENSRHPVFKAFKQQLAQLLLSMS